MPQEVNFIVTFEAKPDAIERAKQEVLFLLESVGKEATCVFEAIAGRKPMTWRDFALKNREKLKY
ncbi:MAG: hypothetical protein ACRC2V_20790 [Xenococcaceae cyanobacterium]